MRRLLVLRPEPGAGETAARAGAAGWVPLCVPLFESRAVAWRPPDPTGFDAVMFTSAAAARLAGPALAGYRALPALAVGAATADAARAAGFREVATGSGDAAALLELATARGWARVLHLAGREHRAASHPGLIMVRTIVYAAEAIGDAAPALHTALAETDVALVHSARAGARLDALVPAPLRATVALAGLSAGAIAATGAGWRAILAAAVPTDAALLAAAATLCDQARSGE